MKPYLCIDTNILLLDANNLITLGKDYTIVLPETTLDEIDAKKSSTDPEIRYQVRAFGRLMQSKTRTAIINQDLLTIIYSTLDGVNIQVVSRSEYPSYLSSEPSIRNDNKIIQIAKDYKDLGKEVIFMTNDIMCSERAAAAGLSVMDFKVVESKPLEFTRELSVQSDIFSTLHHTAIVEVDPNYSPGVFNYIFTDADTGQTKLATLRNGFIDVIGRDSETELRKQDVVPQNSGHLFLSRAIQNPNVDIVVVDAQAGTGKTLTAFSNAIQLIKRKEYGGIVYFRTSVDDVEKAEYQGFRKGTDAEKNAPFFGPIADTLDFIARRRHSGSTLKGRDYEAMIAEEITELQDRYHIEESTNLGLRGRTFNNIVAIIDEVQNYSKPALHKLLTRFGKDCKIILIGSNRQIDHPYITRHNNGLSVILNECSRLHDNVTLHGVTLDRVLRSGIAHFAEEVFTRNYHE